MSQQRNHESIKPIKASSGNLFADLGLDNPEELILTAEIARKINPLITQKNIN